MIGAAPYPLKWFGCVSIVVVTTEHEILRTPNGVECYIIYFALIDTPAFRYIIYYIRTYPASTMHVTPQSCKLERYIKVIILDRIPFYQHVYDTPH